MSFIRSQFVDLAGLVRGRDVKAEYLLRTLARGIPTVPINYLLDINDRPTDPEFGAAAGDYWAVPDTESYVRLPYLSRTGHVFADIVAPDGKAWSRCARSRLREVEALASEEFGVVGLGFEQEGYLLKRAAEGVQRTGSANLLTAEYLDGIHDLLRDLAESLGELGSPVDKLMLEDGSGMLELNVPAGAPRQSADNYVRFKQAFRYFATKHGYVGTFMPKPLRKASGAGLHLHVSVRDKDNRDRLGDSADSRGMGLSDFAYYFVAGLLRHAGAIVAIGSASVNSYKRLQPGTWAPAHAAYGLGNRSTLIRIVQQRSDADEAHPRRIELRSPDGTCNPYLLAAAVLCAGLHGVRERLVPPDPIHLDLGGMSDDQITSVGAPILPRSLDRALDELEADSDLADLLGAELVASYVKVKRSEWASFAEAITDWEYQHYPAKY